jgi:hypothetical protein
MVQKAWGHEIDGAASEECGELPLHPDEGQTRSVARFELDEDVDVAVGSEIPPQDGTEEGQSTDVVAATEVSYLGPIDLNARPTHLTEIIGWAALRLPRW